MPMSIVCYLLDTILMRLFRNETSKKEYPFRFVLERIVIFRLTTGTIRVPVYIVIDINTKKRKLQKTICNFICDKKNYCSVQNIHYRS